MPDWLINILGTIYTRVPVWARPTAKKTFIWGSLRTQALAQRKPLCDGRRVEFLDFETAHLEPFEFVGPGTGEVQIRSLASCVSPGTERAVLCGLPGARRAFPYAPGYSTVGVVERVGRGTNGVKEGDVVAGRMPHASHGNLTRASLFKVPDGVDPVAASFLELGIITLQGVRKARIRPGDRVAVVGQGLIGQMAVRLARSAGAGSIVAVAASRRRAASALGSGGADEFIALSDGPDAMARVEADIVIEAVGSAKAITLAMSAARPGGSVVLLGSSRDLGRHLDWFGIAQARSLTLIGAHISVLPDKDASKTRWTYAQEGRLFLDLLAAGLCDVSSMVTWRPRPEACNEVYEVIADGGREHVGIVFDWAALNASR